ncbi:MAG TPA: carbohydrate binding family 9 domain-containing protein [Terracidiphilus sp.]|nr:carbohydrate binding family 9 domain-containing protein [Terracidiphilus sp.]
MVQRPAAPLIIPRLGSRPTLGDFLGGLHFPATRMLRVTSFIERYPDDGTPPRDSTTAYLGYTHDDLFIAFLCRDRHPDLIRAHMLQRDSLGDDDHVRVMLDTFHDQRRAFVFESNPLGIQADALYSEQDGYDFSFDTVWSTWGRRTHFGYVVLMRIPFASLYFAKAAPGELRTWGIILERSISHSNESDYWPRSNPNVAGQLTQDMAVEGFEGIERGQNLQFEPYALARSTRQLNTANPVNPYFQDKHLQGYSGLDSKFILHNSLVLDTTFNPDFSQVGINNPAAPNQRFPPYFPEVRPFFIENSSYFDTPISLYYINNIITPQYGARLTGKLGPWAMGVLDVDDRSPGQAVPQDTPESNTRAHCYIGRVDRDIGSHSNAGVVYADREYLGSFNRDGGFDYRARVRNRWTYTGQVLTSQTRNVSDSTQGEQKCESRAFTCSGQAWFQQVSYSDLHRSWWLAYSDTSAGFLTDTGFFVRPDVREPNGRFSYTFLPSRGPILSHGPSIYAERIWDHTGLPLDFYAQPSYSFTFKDRTSLYAYVSFGQDRLRPIDYPALDANVEYPTHSEGISVYTSPVPWLAADVGYHAGATINYQPPSGQGPDPVDVTSPSISLDIKPVNAVDLSNSYVFTQFTNPDTGGLVYDNHELISRWNYQFNKALSLNLIGQYIATLPHSDTTDLSNSKDLFGDALLTYMPHPGTALYFGYIGNFANLNRALCTRLDNGLCNAADPILPTTGSSLMNDSKDLYLKASYLLRF